MPAGPRIWLLNEQPARRLLTAAWLERGERTCCHQECPSWIHLDRKGIRMTLVLIGVDPHKGSHTAFAIDQHESSLGELKVRSSKKHPTGWKLLIRKHAT